MRTILAALILVGCSSTGVGNPSGFSETEQALIASGDDALRAGDTASAVVSVTTLALSDPTLLVDAVAVATLAESRTGLYFEPAGCLVTTRTTDRVSFDFQGCQTGAFGLSELSGEVVATYTVTTPGSVDVVVSTPTSLSIGLTEVTLTVQAFFSLSQATRSVVWNGSTHLARPVRPDLDHEASYSAGYDAATQCLSLSGSSTTTFESGSGVQSSLTDYLRCGPGGTCPSGGSLTLTALPDRDRTLTVEYDGDATATVRERDLEIALDCSE